MAPVVNRRRSGADGAIEAHDDEKGFSLVELMVIILISAVLAAVAIPTFLGQRRHAADSSAMERLDAADSVLGEIWGEYHAFPTGSALASAITGLDANLQASSGAQTTGVTPPAPVVVAGTSTQVVMGAEGAGLACLYVDYSETASGPGPGTWYGESKFTPSQASCQVGFSVVPASGWRGSWSALGL